MDVLTGAEKTLRLNNDLILFMDIHPQFGSNPIKVCEYSKTLAIKYIQWNFGKSKKAILGTALVSA